LPWDSVSARKGDPEIPVRTDAYFVLKQIARPDRRNHVHVFLEADRSTMAHSRIAAKIAGYLAYYEQGRHARKYPGMQAFIVATVTQTRSRAVELRKELHPLIPRAASRQAYSFIAFDDFTLASVLSAANSIT
jgi:Replication-relaxation